MLLFYWWAQILGSYDRTISHTPEDPYPETQYLEEFPVFREGEAEKWPENLRPLQLLNTCYKFLSAMIAETMESVL